MGDVSQAGQAIRVLIVDDHPAVREGLRAYLSFMPDLNVVGIAEDGTQAVKLATSTKPDVVLMGDLRMPLCEGMWVTGWIVRQQGSGVVWFSFEDDQDTVLRMIRSGASGFVSKQGPAAEVVQAIRAVGAGKPYFTPEIWRLLVREAKLASVWRATRAKAA